MEASRPNVLWILSDQHHADCLGHTGRRPPIQTPALDTLSATGVTCTNAFCNNPICSPSRLSFITGLYPQTHGFYGNLNHDVPEHNPHTLAALARRAGYQTALIGKGHMIHAWDEEGFEHRQYDDGLDARAGTATAESYPDYLAARRLTDQAKVEIPLSPPTPNCPHAFLSPLPHEHTVEAWTGSRTLHYLQQRDPQRPFFVQMSFQRPHAPYSISTERDGMVAPNDIRLPDNAADLFRRRFAGKPRHQRVHVLGHGHFPCAPQTPDELQRILAHYYALITIMDEEIGRVLAWLEAEGIAQHTIVVYTSDHGDFAGDHGLMHKTLGLYESIHRIPLLLRWPGGPADTTIDNLCESVDLYPTLAELMGLTPEIQLDGRSLLALLRGDVPPREAVVCEWPAGPSRYAVRTARYRLVHTRHGTTGELYDRRTDPGELDNRHTDPELQDVRLALTERLVDHLAKRPAKTGLENQI